MWSTDQTRKEILYTHFQNLHEKIPKTELLSGQLVRESKSLLAASLMDYYQFGVPHL